MKTSNRKGRLVRNKSRARKRERYITSMEKMRLNMAYGKYPTAIYTDTDSIVIATWWSRFKRWFMSQ